MKPNYKIDPRPIEACFRDAYLIGDSVTRELFVNLETRWGQPGDHDAAPVHTNLSFPLDDGHYVDFLWDPYLNQTHIADLRNTKPSLQAGVEQWYSPTSVITGAGLWHARHLDDEFEQRFEADVRHLLRSRFGLRQSEARPIFMPIIPPYYPHLDEERAAWLTPDRIDALNNLLYNLTRQYHVDMLLAPLSATQPHPSAYQEDGLHHKPFITDMQLEILTARLCPLSYDYSCCATEREMPWQQLLAISAVELVIIVWLAKALKHSGCPGPVVQAAGIVAATVGYCVTADRTNVFEEVTKLVDEQLFSIFCYVALVAGLLTIRKCGGDHTGDDRTWADEILPRQQTDEWKGWMQIVILLYHYFGMSHTLWVYRTIRLLVASYLFLTGYGHASYFIKTNDFSLRRLTAVLIRINLLSVILPFVMNTHYQLYYFPMLASFWFLVTWATVPRSPSGGLNIRVSAFAWICSISIFGYLSTIWLVDGFFALLYHIGMTSFDFQEYKFRINLDFYIPYVGILAAFVVSLAKERRENFDWLHLDRWRSKQLLWALAASAGVSYFAFVHILSHGAHGKERFNAYHSLSSWIPIVSYVILRNATPTLRAHYSQFFAWFGRHSLETFVLQYHIWLAADTHGILHLGLVDSKWTSDTSTRGSWRFWFEVLLITAIFLWVAQAAAKATGTIVDWIAPKPANGYEKLDSKQEDLGPLWPPTPTAVWKRLPIATEEVKLRARVAAIFGFLWLINAGWPAR